MRAGESDREERNMRCSVSLNCGLLVSVSPSVFLRSLFVTLSFFSKRECVWMVKEDMKEARCRVSLSVLACQGWNRCCYLLIIVVECLCVLRFCFSRCVSAWLFARLQVGRAVLMLSFRYVMSMASDGKENDTSSPSSDQSLNYRLTEQHSAQQKCNRASKHNSHISTMTKQASNIIDICYCPLSRGLSWSLSKRECPEACRPSVHCVAAPSFLPLPIHFVFFHHVDCLSNAFRRTSERDRMGEQQHQQEKTKTAAKAKQEWRERWTLNFEKKRNPNNWKLKREAKSRVWAETQDKTIDRRRDKRERETGWSAVYCCGQTRNNFSHCATFFLVQRSESISQPWAEVMMSRSSKRSSRSIKVSKILSNTRLTKVRLVFIVSVHGLFFSFPFTPFCFPLTALAGGITGMTVCADFACFCPRSPWATSVHCLSVYFLQAMAIQVFTLMWLRTTMNWQYVWLLFDRFTWHRFFVSSNVFFPLSFRYRNGCNSRTALKLLYKEGGILRFYRGLLPALIQGPLARFGWLLPVVLCLIICFFFHLIFSVCFRWLFCECWYPGNACFLQHDGELAHRCTDWCCKSHGRRLPHPPYSCGHCENHHASRRQRRTARPVIQEEAAANLSLHLHSWTFLHLFACSCSALGRKFKLHGPTVFFHGALATAAATAVG